MLFSLRMPNDLPEIKTNTLILEKSLYNFYSNNPNVLFIPYDETNFSTLH